MKRGNGVFGGKFRRLPRKPGVYLIKDASGDVIYVGKAVDLRRRVASHFSPRAKQSALSSAMAEKAADVDCVVTDTEKEALLLEHNLIREHRPKFNAILKEGSKCAYIRLAAADDYPALGVTRDVRRDGSRYFGPYLSAEAARKTARFIQRLAGIRDCGEAQFSSRKRPCLKYQMSRCSAPCCGMISREKYGRGVRMAALFLSGKTGELIARLRGEMEIFSKSLEYEEAARIRDLIEAVENTTEKQKIVTPDEADRDIVGLFREGERGSAAILSVRGGKLIGGKNISLERASLPEPFLLRRILMSHYLGGALIPPEILVPVIPDGRKTLDKLLAGERKGAVRIIRPLRGEKKALVRMAASNAEAAFAAERGMESRIEALLRELEDRFRLPRTPRWIECVDISHLGGAAAVGSLVAFKNGAADKSGYRRFGIRGKNTSDDCRMIYEVLSRRIRRGAEEGGLPDLILVDGGRGQLGAALRAMRETGAAETAVLAIAKGKGRGGDSIYAGGAETGFGAVSKRLKSSSPVLLFLQRIRDEAHGFACRFHRKRMASRLLSSELGSIEGIGPGREALLRSAFGDIRGIAAASLEELEKILRNRAAARRVRDHFHP